MWKPIYSVQSHRHTTFALKVEQWDTKKDKGKSTMLDMCLALGLHQLYQYNLKQA